jgi:hypothetical protein
MTAKKVKYTESDLQHAWAVFEWFREKDGDAHRFVRKDGVKYVRCQHLRDRTQSAEVFNLWAGDNLRFILCPICANVDLGRYTKLLHVDLDDVGEYSPPEKDIAPIPENWKDRFLSAFRRLWSNSDNVKGKGLTPSPPPSVLSSHASRRSCRC